MKPAVIVPAPAPADPRPYLEYLHRYTSHIEIRGLAVSTGQTHLVPIDELYVTLRDERGQSESRERSRWITRSRMTGW